MTINLANQIINALIKEGAYTPEDFDGMTDEEKVNFVQKFIDTHNLDTECPEWWN